MSYPDETMRLARDLAEGVVRLARELLQAGADLAYVQTVYTTAAIEMLSEAEAHSGCWPQAATKTPVTRSMRPCPSSRR
jgi:hypothetical protein